MTVINWPMGRLLLSYAANTYARVVTGLKLYDATGGFKCFRREVLEAINLDTVRSNGYAFQIEMSFRVWRKGFRILEIPIVFTDRTDGISKMSGAIVREAIWMVWRLRLSAMVGPDLTGIVLFKMTGSGNDFVFVDARSSPLAAGPLKLFLRSVTVSAG